VTALVYVFASGLVKSTLPNTPAWATPTLAIACIANVVFAVALFQWKKWGFYGFAATTVLALFINLKIGLQAGRVLFGLIGIVILYAVLQIGGAKKGWTQLE
jgi:hypothetical protein